MQSSESKNLFGFGYGVPGYVHEKVQYAKSLFENVNRKLQQQRQQPLSGNADSDADSLNDKDAPFSLISNFESQLIELQSLLIWERPRDSIIALIYFTCFYWTVVLWEPRLLSVVATLGFCYHFYEMWTRYVWPEIRAPSVVIKEKWTSVNPNVLSAPEIKIYFSRIKIILLEYFEKIKQFRKQSHGAFCCYSILFFVCFYYVGRCIPGVVITYCIAVGLFITPGLLAHVVPKNTFDKFTLKEPRKLMMINDNDQPKTSITVSIDNCHSLQPQSDNDDESEISQSQQEGSSFIKKLFHDNLSPTSATFLFTKENNFRVESSDSSTPPLSLKTSSSLSSSSSVSSSTDSDSDFVMISDSELIEM